MIVAGAVLALISLAGLSWYSITGPNVVSDLSEVDPGGVVLVVSPDRGVQHSWLVWVLFAVCLGSALAAGWASGGVSSTGRVLASALAVLLIVDAVARVALPGFAAGHAVPSRCARAATPHQQQPAAEYCANVVSKVRARSDRFIGDRRLARIAQRASPPTPIVRYCNQMPNSSGEALNAPWQDLSPRPARTGDVLFGGVTIMLVAASGTQLRIDGCR